MYFLRHSAPDLPRTGWGGAKVDEVLLPILKRMHSREVMEGVIQVGGAAAWWGPFAVTVPRYHCQYQVAWDVQVRCRGWRAAILWR